jgi:hypothetical protein
MFKLEVRTQMRVDGPYHWLWVANTTQSQTNVGALLNYVLLNHKGKMWRILTEDGVCVASGYAPREKSNG